MNASTQFPEFEEQARAGNTGGNCTGSEDPWHEEPIPLTGGEVPDLPAAPLEELPGIFGEYAREVARVAQVDSALPLVVMLGVISTCLRGMADIILPSHRETVTAFLKAIAPSGERKSEVFKRMMKPVYAFIEAVRRELEPERREIENARAILEKRIEKLRKAAASGKNADEAREFQRHAARATEELAATKFPGDPLAITSDVTEEKLGQLLAQNNEYAAIMSSEGGGLVSIWAGKYSDGAAIDLLLKAHTGDPHQIHRVTRPAINLDSPVVTVCVTCQPEVARSLGEKTDLRGMGLHARFAFAWCKPRAGTRTLQREDIPQSVTEAYAAAVQNLLRTEFAQSRGELDFNEPPQRAEFRLSNEAELDWEAFYAGAEASLAPGGDLHEIPDWGSKLPGFVARLAGLFHFSEHAEAAPGVPVSAEHMKAAITLGGYFADHARVVFAIMAEDAELAGARRILETIKRHRLRQFIPSDIIRHSGVKKMADVVSGLEVLTDRGWIREVVQPYSSSKGRPPIPRLETHPSAWGQK